jgi:L-serine dehydratase
MAISIFDLIKIGVGPSSSHTMGPMLAARRFLLEAREAGVFDRIERVGAQLYGSLALTGKGHCTDRAILLGWEGEEPRTIEPATVESRLERIRGAGRLQLLGEREIAFDEPMDLLFHREQVLPRHTNGMRFSAFDGAGETLCNESYYSIGGGFVLRGDEPEADGVGESPELPFPFDTAEELLAQCRQHDLLIHELVLANETTWRSETETREHLLELWQVMKDCVHHGFEAAGVLPGVLKVPRRAPRLYRELCGEGAAGDFMDWLDAYALAVNEENAAGGRIVTAPTNGAAGIIPAVLHYYRRFVSGADEDGVARFLLTAGAIAILYKKNASISGAEMGCQGEVGVACSMAAGGLVAAMGGSNAQVENAAEIGMEHNLGLTCDPIAGLVQIPCIERNAMGAVKAVNAARMAFRGDGSHKVSLDQVIATMRQTGLDMSTSYKETSKGGLAVNVPEC